MNAIAVVITSVVVALLLAWKEIRRPQRAHLALRLIATFVAVASLACLALPLQYPVVITENNAAAIVLLTKGTGKNEQPAYKGLSVYTTDPALANRSNQYIPDIPWFTEQHPLVKKINITGYGLNAYEQQWLAQKNINITYQPPAAPAGFIAAGWPRQLHPGDVLEVQGVYNNDRSDSVKIVFSGLGTRFDSVTVAGDTSLAFSLSCQPSHLGNTLYELSASSAGNTISTEKVPVTLSPVNGLQVVLLSSAPGFENRFLVNWLYENKYKVSTRNAVSRNKYQQEFLNTARASLQTITTSLLEKTDVLIADDESLASLNAAEKAALQEQVRQGMGLIVQVDSAKALSSFSQGFPIRKQAEMVATARPLKLADRLAATAPVLPEQWFSIETTGYDQPLVTDPKDAVLVSARLYGAGKIMANTVSNTFSWVLSGNRPDYAQFWSLLLHKAARHQQQDNLWQQATDFPAVGTPVQLTLQAGNDPGRIPVIHTPGGKVYVSQQAALPDTWTGTWWPVEKGWQTISSGDTTSLYIYDAGDWAAARAYRSIGENKALAEKQIHTTNTEAAIEQKVMKQVPPLVFFGLFLLSCAYLWIETKRS